MTIEEANKLLHEYESKYKHCCHKCDDDRCVDDHGDNLSLMYHLMRAALLIGREEGREKRQIENFQFDVKGRLKCICTECGKKFLKKLSPEAQQNIFNKN